MEIKHWYMPQAKVPVHASEFSLEHGRIRTWGILNITTRQ